MIRPASQCESSEEFAEQFPEGTPEPVWCARCGDEPVDVQFYADDQLCADCGDHLAESAFERANAEYQGRDSDARSRMIAARRVK